MSQNENDGFAQFTATGGELNVPFDFKIADRAEIKIIRKRSGVEATLVLNTDYTIADNQLNQDLGGVAVLIGSATPALASDIYTALLNTPYSRGVLDGSSDFNQSGDFFAATLNKQLDFLIRMVNRLARDTAKSLKFSETLNISTAIITETIASGRALIAGSAPGTFIQGPTATDIANAQTYASNASTSASNAATSETNAANSAAAAQASAAGMKWRPSVKSATTANITLSGAQTIDGVSIVAGDRVLVKNQLTASQNGVYVAASGAWARAADADTYEELISQVIVVEEGSVSADKLFICTINSGGTLGVTSITWAELSIAIADGSIGFAKLSSGDIATSANIFAGAANKIATASAIKTVLGSVLHVQDQKASGTSAGTFTAGAWQTRTLNTAVINTITGASLASNQITLPAGTYKINCTLPAVSVDQHQARLQNITDGTTTLSGGCFRSWSSSANSTPADLFGIFTIAATKVFEVQHRCAVTRAADGLGIAASFGTEVYANVFIEMV